MWPTLVNLHSAFCHGAISAASAAASSGFAARQRARTASSSSDGSSLGQRSSTACRDTSRSARARAATASMVLLPAVQRFALGERRGEIFLERQPAAFVGVEDDALQVDLVAAAARR